jgi:ABC-2 type transport system ATP-binding protein
MDVESRRAFWDDMRRSAAEGRTVLFATHYLDEADQVADRIVILDHGRIVADGSPATLKASVSERAVRFELADGPAGDPRLGSMPGVLSEQRRGSEVTLATRDADATVRGLVRAGIDFRHLEVVGADLEAAFLALTSPAPDVAA